MSIEHDFFGLLDGDDGELHWSEGVDAGDQYVDVDLRAPSEQSVTDEALDVAAAMVNSLEQLDSRAREAFVAEIGQEGSNAMLYLTSQFSELDPEILAESLDYDSGDRDIDVLRSLKLLRVGFHPHHSGSEEQFAVFEYALAPDESDSILSASFDMQGDVVSTDVDA
ncbi:hypothetical protein ASF62_00150 [Leifsonia sp. Leaf325]|nr:DUF2004 domain-containing protein [Leifsonia sp. Leaf325]KQQ95020.1 hypothetical protein ASF62_00150 [Leifsonia sp. Leaf325]